MNERFKEAIHNIPIPAELHQRAQRAIVTARQQHVRKWPKWLVASTIVAALIGGVVIMNVRDGTPPGVAKPTAPESEPREHGVAIPAMQLPKTNATLDMMGLIVYRHKVYLQTADRMDVVAAKLLLGEKLGTTTGTIDEWSTQADYSHELASTIAPADVYSVKGYDKNVRIMAYVDDGVNGEFAQFYECFNGITLFNGEDMFGKLNVRGHVVSARFRTFDEWNNDILTFHPLNDMTMINEFVDDLYQATPILRGVTPEPIERLRSNTTFKELALNMKDGSVIRLILLKGGYVYYFYNSVYFKIEEEEFSKIWSALN